MLMKSVVGYGLAAMVAYIAWICVSKFINEKFDEVDEKWVGFWRNSVWISSGWLWWVWLSHDVANIAVYLPRQLDLTLLLIVMGYFTALLFYIFYIQGGPIQKVVLDSAGDSSRIIYLAHVGADDGLYHSFSANTSIKAPFTTGTLINKTNNTTNGLIIESVTEDNKVSETEQNQTFSSISDDFLDFTENNPFGDPENQ